MINLHPEIEGKYEVLGKFREGGMGTVFKVRHRLLQEIRVVKILNPHLGASQEVRQRFLREARFAIQLRHPNIAQLHDFSIAEDHTAFIVMEFIDGLTLAEILAGTGPLSIGLGMEIARQALKALGFLHRRGLVHRDISPDNLMLTRDPDEGKPLCKLIDLGIAKVLTESTGELTSTGMFLGKPKYASPEQFSGHRIDSRSDLYSFGVVLYEILTGRNPIEGNDLTSLMAGHLIRPPVDFTESDPHDRLPQDLRDLLLRLLAKKPDERFASAEEIIQLLSTIQGRFPFHPEDLDEALLSSTSTQISRLPSNDPSQGRLDREFVQVPTPSHGSLTEQAAGRKTKDNDATRQSIQPMSASTLVLPRHTEGKRPPSSNSRVHARTTVAAILAVVLIATGLAAWKLRSLSGGQQESTLSADDKGPEVSNDDSNDLTSTGKIGKLRQEPSGTPNPENSANPDTARRVIRRSPTDERPISTPAERSSIQVRPQQPSKPEATDRLQETPQVVQDSPPQPEPATAEQENRDLHILSLPSPIYPVEAKGTGSYARIVIAVNVDVNGTVAKAQVMSAYFESGIKADSAQASSTFLPLFRKAALDAVRQARFSPARKNGTPEPASTKLTIEFGRKVKN